MKIDDVLWQDVATMSDDDLNREIHFLRRAMLERSIEAAITMMSRRNGHSQTVERFALETALAAIDADDDDSDLEETGDFEDGGDWEEENENGGDILDEPHDELDQGDLEPFLGWPEECSLYDAMAVLRLIDMAADDPNDTDALPLAGEPLDFRGDGKQAARELIRKAQCKVKYWFAVKVPSVSPPTSHRD